MPTTTNQSADDPATLDPQTQVVTSEDSAQAEGCLESLQALAAADTTESTTLGSETTQQIELTSVEESAGASTAEDPNSSLQYDNEILSEAVPATSAAILSQSDPATFSDSAPAVIPAPSKGFQDAFAAFASATLPGPEDEEMEVQEDTEDTVAHSDPAQPNLSESMVTTYLEPTEVDPSLGPNVSDGPDDTAVSSAVDSGLVNATEDLAADQPEASTQQVLQSEQPASEVEEQLYHEADKKPTEPVDQTLAENQVVDAMESQEQLMEQHAVPDQLTASTTEQQAQEASVVSDSVYFIQGTDATGEVVTSIIDPNDIGSYLDSVVYKQCMLANGEIETTIVHSGVQPAVQEQQQQQQQEEQVIYAHDLNGQLTPIDSAQSANDVAPPGKQFVYMQDSTGRIIRTIMDANQTMVPGQQVYYTQSDDGRIITSVMDPNSAGGAAEEQPPPQQTDQVAYQQQQQQDAMMDNSTAAGIPQQQPEIVGETANFNLDSGLSGLDMLAELSHLTAGQTPTASGLASEHKGTSSTDSNSADMDEFRPVAMVTRRIGVDEGLDDVNSTLSGLNVGHQESPVYKLISELKPELQVPALSVSRDNLFVQWQNLDAMCWMDVVLIMLVYSPTLRPLVNLDPGHELASTLLITLLKANRQAQVLVQNLLKKSNGAEVSGLQTGAGNTSTSIQDPKTAKLVCKENMDEIGKAINILYAMREKIWQALQPRLRCERGKHNSPVLVLPLLVREKPAIKQMFTMNYRYVFKCEKCGYTQDDVHTKILPSIPAVPDDFNMKEPCFVRNCFECQAPNQRMKMKFEGLQDFVQMHFVKGLPHNRFDELSFDFQGDHYEVTAVVHYKNNPDHFIAWVRNAPGSTWMECDDLKSVITRYHHTVPLIPPSQVHMVLWERRLTPAHQLQMRDTEDTKVLASLVLTVQQPSTHQTSDPAARPSGLPSTSPSNPGPGKASSLLSAIPNQSPVFSPYIPRGRGRGRGRGSRGGRGAASASSTPIIRRTTPISLTGNTGASQTGSPQIVRLPLSALSNSSGSSLGSTPSTTKYVLMGNNGAGQGTSGTASKVVVVRSQGGANNLTAQQLLQLLQRTGAITQSGAKIAIATSGANTTAAITSAVTTSTSTLVSSASKGSTSYIIQSDGTIMTTNAPVSTVAKPIQSGVQLTNTGADLGSTGAVMDTSTSAGDSKPSVKLVSVLPSALASLTSAYGQVNSANAIPQNAGSGQMLLDQSSSSQASDVSTSLGTEQTFSTQESSEPPATPQVPDGGKESLSEANIQQTSESNPLLVSPETTAAPAIATSSSTTPQQQATASRFIQIPTSGGGSILTQLVVRNGKMVLVPVDKATQAQAQAQPSSVLKLSGGAVGSASKITLRTATSGTSQILSGSAISSQPQQQQQMDVTASSPSTPSSSAVGTLGYSNLVSKGNQSFITMPGTKGSTPKRTIQLISVPRSGQTNAKTFILNSGGDSTSAARATTHQLALPAEPAANNTACEDQAVDAGSQGRILSQEGNIVIRELRRPEASPATLTTTLMGDSSGSLMSTPAVSLLRGVSANSSGLSAVDEGQKQPESFKYILPGSNTTHILHTGSSASTGQVASRAFTALSSSGTIIGGQLTPAVGSTTMGTSPMDQDLGFSDQEEGGGIFGLGTTEYIPVNRGRGRGGRGSRGSKTPRGSQRGRGRGGKSSGKGRTSSELWSSMEMVAPGSSALSGLREVGAHVIESGAENVDGVPVLSIPEFSANQAEASSAVEAIQGETQHMVPGADGILGQADQQPLEAWTSPEASIASSAASRILTQPIPSVKANHGFDILTQGILGREASGPPQTFKKARSLLTGAQVTTATPTFSFSGTPEHHVGSNFSVPESSALQAEETTVPDQSSVQPQHSEIDTLIEAALAAAKPVKANSAEQAQDESSQSVLYQEKETHLEPGKHDQRVVSVEERHVSTAEKYRMPVELFQPDDEPYEKLGKSDMWSTKILEPEEQPGALDPEHQNLEALDQARVEEGQEGLMETEEKQVDEEIETVTNAPEIQEEQQADVERGKLHETKAVVDMEDDTRMDGTLVPDSLPSTVVSEKGEQGNQHLSLSQLPPEHLSSPKQIVDSEKEALGVPMDTSSSSPLQSRLDNKDLMAAGDHVPAQDDQFVEQAETEQFEESQKTISMAREEESGPLESTRKAPSKPKTKKSRTKGKSTSKKARLSTEKKINSSFSDTEQSSRTQDVLALEENQTPSNFERVEVNNQEKSDSFQSNAEKVTDILETNATDVTQDVSVACEEAGQDSQHLPKVESDTSLPKDSNGDETITQENACDAAQMNSNAEVFRRSDKEEEFGSSSGPEVNTDIEAQHKVDVSIKEKAVAVEEEDQCSEMTRLNGERTKSLQVEEAEEIGENENMKNGQSVSREEVESKDVSNTKQLLKECLKKVSKVVFSGRVAPVCSHVEERLSKAVLSRPRRQRVDWAKQIARREEDNHFNYDVLSGGKLSKTTRHPSVDFTSRLQAPKKKRVPSTDKSLPAKVTRRHEKLLQPPKVDPSKDPSLVPLVVEGDKPCTGGSVITIPAEGEMFTGIVVGQKRQRADWTCDDHDDGENAWDSSLSPEETRLAQAQYCQQLAMVLFMEAGDLSFLLRDEDENEADDNISECSFKSISGAEDIKDDVERLTDIKKQAEPQADNGSSGVKDVYSSGRDQHEQVEGSGVPVPDPELNSKPDLTCQTKPGKKRGRKKKSGRKSVASPSLPVTPSETPPTKRQRLSQDDDDGEISAAEMKTQVLQDSTTAELEVSPLQDSSAHTNLLPHSGADDCPTVPSNPALQVEAEKKRGRPRKNPTHPVSPGGSQNVSLDISSSKALHMLQEGEKTLDMSEVNNTDDILAPCHTNGLSSPQSMDVDQTEETNTYLPAAVSPSRRSSRTSIPSKKILE
ncbi:SUMO-specific isopeptidase USPL1 [Elysia marginata]|uniref:SUMO-specific isopeptidase USPL1 n=1 Tax=Elysia marginata TaxID=1093978 RepID=A0AAV4I1Y0_9GAST|nr:SUMO-specific isopeptidase USPL1 [Elysia marginata]